MNKAFRLVVAGIGSLVVAAALGPSALPAQAANAPKCSAWTAPVNLGPLVNTSASESCPNISMDGLTLYFARGGNVEIAH